jgi:hypothetical protein
VFDGNGKTLANWNGIAPWIINLSGTVKNLSLTNASMTGAYRVGLIAGTVTSSGVVDDCHVAGSLNTSYMTGGLVGLNQGQISNSSANVAISGTDHMGGLVGVNSGTITNSSASGVVISSTSVAANGLSGGLVAWNVGGTITHSYSNATVTGENGVGGLIGQDSSGTISTSYATGSVTGLAGVGGFVGLSNSSTIHDCYATGVVHATSDAGGFVGDNGSVITNVFSTGGVASGAHSGGLVGANSITITPQGGSPTTYNGAVSHSYWDQDASGVLTSAAGTGESTVLMFLVGTFTSWNFSTVWNSPSGDYPSLK